jgi:hypothetical protein
VTGQRAASRSRHARPYENGGDGIAGTLTDLYLPKKR